MRKNLRGPQNLSTQCSRHRRSDGTWPEAAAAKIAARLVTSLPEGAVADIPQTEEARVASLTAAKAGKKAKPSAKGATVPAPAAAAPKANLTTWLMWGALALALYFLIMQMTPDSNFETSERETTQQ